MGDSLGPWLDDGERPVALTGVNGDEDLLDVEKCGAGEISSFGPSGDLLISTISERCEEEGGECVHAGGSLGLDVLVCMLGDELEVFVDGFIVKPGVYAASTHWWNDLLEVSCLEATMTILECVIDLGFPLIREGLDIKLGCVPKGDFCFQDRSSCLARTALSLFK